MADRLAAAYGWPLEDILWRVPASAGALLLRRRAAAEGRGGFFPLSSVEQIDGGQ